MKVLIKNLIFKDKKTLCVFVSAVRTMFDFDYKKFKGIIIVAGGATYLRLKKILIIYFLLTTVFL
jgi:hypothetical protein